MHVSITRPSLPPLLRKEVDTFGWQPTDAAHVVALLSVAALARVMPAIVDDIAVLSVDDVAPAEMVSVPQGRESHARLSILARGQPDTTTGDALWGGGLDLTFARQTLYAGIDLGMNGTQTSKHSPVTLRVSQSDMGLRGGAMLQHDHKWLGLAVGPRLRWLRATVAGDLKRFSARQYANFGASMTLEGGMRFGVLHVLATARFSYFLSYQRFVIDDAVMRTIPRTIATVGLGAGWTF